VGTLSGPRPAPAAAMMLAAALVVAFPCPAAGAGPARIVFQGDPSEPGFGTVTITGLADDVLGALSTLAPEAAAWSRIFPVHTARARKAGGSYPAVLGRYEIVNGAVRFTPRYPLAAGLAYEARLDAAALSEATGLDAAGNAGDLTASFSMPEPKLRPSTIVEAVYPTADLLPANLLRLYVHFSSPMRAKEASGHVRLYDEEGAEVELPFVEVREGLWDPGQRRLTLFFHPGRLKRGVAPNEEMGPPLVEGRGYRLVVDAEMRDDRGQPLARAYEKGFRVAAADRRSPDPGAWRLIEPGGLDDPVLLDFGEPLDRGLLDRMITVWDSEGWPIEGEVEVSGAETRWSFHPGRPWKPGEYTIHVSPALEDLAGNTLDRLFDETMGAEPAPEPAAAPIRIPFTIRG